MEGAGHLFHHLIALLKRGGIWWGLAISIAAAVLSFAVATAIVVSWPADRFKDGAVVLVSTRPAAIRALALVAKNLAGVLLVLLGLIMAIPGVPGQGLLTAVIGLTLVSFPGKRDVERRFVRLPMLLRGINRLRARFARPPLEVD
jgi:hypothetical protein